MNAPAHLPSAISREDRAALVDAVRRLLVDHSTEADVRRAMDTPKGFDGELWRHLAETGLAGLVIDEAYGGSGGGPLEIEAVMEEAGAALLCSPLLASSVLSAELIRALGDPSAIQRLLPGVASGERIVASALTGDAGLWTAASVAVTASGAGESRCLTGHASYVLHGQNADTLLVIAKDAQGLAVFEMDADAEGVTITPLRTFDHTLRLARIVFDDAPARPLKAHTPAWRAVEQALDLVLVALAGEQAGAAKRVLHFTVDYAKTRVQFGRPIGGFQAIKHMAADLLLESESATSAARNAARKLAEAAHDAEAAVSLAAFACADAFVTVAASAIQMHGGIAFTWDHPAHLYLKRARSGAALFGGSNAHRERYLSELEAGRG